MKNNPKLLNLNYLKYTNETYSCGPFDFPYITNVKVPTLDYIALYSDKREYHKTPNTAVAFYEYDNIFDGINGLFNAIYYDHQALINKYKERFKGVKYVISPDYSQCGDVQVIENLYRYFKAAIVSLFFILELDIEVIPNITYASKDYFPYMLNGIEDVEVICFSLVGSYKNLEQRELLSAAIDYCLIHLSNLKQIILYRDNLSNDDVLPPFSKSSREGNRTYSAK